MAAAEQEPTRSHRGVDSGPGPRGFAEEVYGHDRSGASSFADAVYGVEEREPYHPNAERWAYWVDRFIGNVAEDRDNFLLVKGTPGCGKSTFSLHLAKRAYPEITPSTLKDHIAFSIVQFHQLVLGSHDTYLQLDEAAVGAGSVDWNSEEARALVETAQTMRWRHLTVALLIPNPQDLMAALRDRRTEFHVACSHRPKGSAIIREKNWELHRPLKRGDPGTRTRWEWNPLTWAPFARSDPLWKEYSRLKREADDARARKHLVLLSAREAVTTGQAAEALSVTRDSVENWIKTGKVRANRTPGGHYRIPIEELEQLVSERGEDKRPRRPNGPRRA